MNKWLNRVPEVTFYFWLIKVLATTVGETAADFLANTLGFGLAATSYVMSGILAIRAAKSVQTKTLCSSQLLACGCFDQCRWYSATHRR